jgi:hypothetical protein
MSRFFKKPHIGKKRFKYQFDLIIDSVQVSRRTSDASALTTLNHPEPP